MAKKNGGGSKNMLTPIYTAPGQSLGPTRPSGPMGGKSVPDPIGLTHGKFATGPSASGNSRKQSHDKD